MAIINCPKCKKDNEENAKFCSWCGCNLLSDNISTFNNNSQNTTLSNNTELTHNLSSKKFKSWIIITISVIAVLFIAIKLIQNDTKNSFEDILEDEIESILENDLSSSVKINKLYYNEDKNGCLVEFKTNRATDIAAINLGTGKIEYQSEFDYYSGRLEILRKQSPINEEELSKCCDKILSMTNLVGWKFTIESEGSTAENGWQKIK